jgi:hypothetical protein
MLFLLYGEPVENIQFDYVYNDDPDNPLSIPPEVNTQILSLLQAGHATALVNGKSIDISWITGYSAGQQEFYGFRYSTGKFNWSD